MIASFVDRDMIMRYFGGGIGHLNNTPPQQADPLGSNLNSDEMDMEENEDDTGTSDARDRPQDVVMLEVDEPDEEGGSGDNDDDGDDSDNYDYEENDEDDSEDSDGEEAEEPTCSGDKDEEYDYGYASP